jgi:hypothetical protein
LLALTAVLAGVEMTTLLAVIAIIAILLVILVWISPFKGIATWVLSILIALGCACSEIKVFQYDRPILPPVIEAIAFVNNGTKYLGLDMEVLVKNGGLISGYADEWEMDVLIDGKSVESRQLYGRPLPITVVNEPELDGEEFPPGKPVRGWLFFEFTSITYDTANTYFSCGSQQLEKVKFKLAVLDSKRHRRWEETKSLAELGPSACIPLPLAAPEAQAHTRSKEAIQPTHSQESLPSNTKTISPPIQSQQPSQVVNAQNGIGAIGSTVINPQVYNYGYMPKTLSNEQAENIVELMRPLNDGTDRGDLITSQLGDTNSLEVALQLVKIFRTAGWNLSGSGYNQAVYSNPPEPLLILVHSAASTPDGKVDNTSLPSGIPEFGKILHSAGVNVGISVDASIPPGKFRIIVGIKP